MSTREFLASATAAALANSGSLHDLATDSNVSGTELWDLREAMRWLEALPLGASLKEH